MEKPQQSSPVGELYQFRIWLREISPMVWRRLLLRDVTTVRYPIFTMQSRLLLDGVIHTCIVSPFAGPSTASTIQHPGGPWFTADARQVHLADLHLRRLERFTYEYDFGDSWIHEIRLEEQFPIEACNNQRAQPARRTRSMQHTYPTCIGGARGGPPEDCGGAWAFMTQRQHYTPFFVAQQLSQMLSDGTIEDYREELSEMCRWLECERFDRRATNRRLHLYATGGEWWTER